MKSINRIFATAVAMTLSMSALTAYASESLNVYSARKEALIKPILEDFTKETGINVKLITGKDDALLTRIVKEGRNTPADILITTDAGRLHRAKEANVTATFSSPLLEKNIPAHYRDSDKQWVGLSLRARPIMYVKGRIDPKELSTYEALTDSKWKKRICIRSSNNIYNQSLVASLIKHNGEEATQQWAKGLVSNLARKPQGGDRDQIKAAVAGQCDIAVANTYYLAGMLNADAKSQAIAKQIAVFWPNQNDRGTHVNVSGAAIIKHSKNQANAIKLIEYLSGDHAQQWYAEKNGEYPVRDNVKISDTLAAWGNFKADTLSLSELGRLNKDAVMLMDRAGWR
jgi:iron(III) transport system substrate-binding protein